MVGVLSNTDIDVSKVGSPLYRRKLTPNISKSMQCQPHPHYTPTATPSRLAFVALRSRGRSPPLAPAPPAIIASARAARDGPGETKCCAGPVEPSGPTLPAPAGRFGSRAASPAPSTDGGRSPGGARRARGPTSRGGAASAGRVTPARATGAAASGSSALRSGSAAGGATSGRVRPRMGLACTPLRARNSMGAG